MSAITSANVANAIVKLVAMDALPALMANLVMGRLVNRNYEAAQYQQGDTVNIPIPPAMVANKISEGGTVQTQNPSLGNAQIVLNQHAECTFTIPDVTRVIAFPNLLAQYMGPALVGLAESVESDMLNLYPLLTANASVGTGGAGLGSEAVVDNAEKALFKAKVPQGLRKTMVVSTDAYSDLRQIPRFTEAQTNGDGQAIVSGTIGKIKDFDVYRSQLVPTVGGTTYNMAFASDALALVTRRLPQPLPGTGAIAQYAEEGSFGCRVIMSYAPNTLAQQFTVDILYGTGVLRNAFGLQVLS